MKNLFFIISICFAVSCNSQPSTLSMQYKNVVNVSKKNYSKDSLQIDGVLRMMLNKHLHPFKPDEQFDLNTRILIDSIIYSKDILHMIVFVITKNNTNKLLKKENSEMYFYNGNYLFCSRENKNSPIKVYDYTGFNLVYYYNYKDLKKRLREYCFIDMGKEKGKYNIDDIRFWKSDDFKWVINNSEATQIR
ncbi:hypothetical protein KXQ82_02035 [Mucilaginibacter sp. HMF5004]|uniref:hypothetical protein n=1 Tax=Mucilaginibacter rivuli TaxID=2857527 RepID=UPI001C5E2563|nr:hypothetical protein [Mucilaginibacter rivuli]MBW4888470.1 hypothetical protein [Mucilaginibacter rivuli]